MEKLPPAGYAYHDASRTCRDQLGNQLPLHPRQNHGDEDRQEQREKAEQVNSAGECRQLTFKPVRAVVVDVATS